MSWEHGRQLASYTDSDGVKTTYTYNADGIRTSKTTNGITTDYYVIDGTMRRMSDGTNTLRFVYGNGLSSVIYNGTEYWYLFNAQGDVVGLIDATGTYVVEYTYDSWGKPLSKTGSLATTLGTLNPFRYRGYVYDEESGFYYVSSRYYDPVVGRWLNADGEIAGVGGDVLGHNAYAYCFNNPVNMDDPTGNWPSFIKGIVNSVVNVISSAVNAIAGLFKQKTTVQHYVPLYNQGDSQLCWAYSQTMIEDYQAGVEKTPVEADIRAMELATNVNGQTDWDQAAWPTNCLGYDDNGTPEGRIEAEQCSLSKLYSQVEKGPIYAYYESQKRAHLVVVTGVNYQKELIYTNNPWGYRGIQSYDQFINGFIKGPTDGSYSLRFCIIPE